MWDTPPGHHRVDLLAISYTSNISRHGDKKSPPCTLHTYTKSRHVASSHTSYIIPNPERQVDMSPHHTLHTYTTPRETGRHVATPHTSYIYQTLRDRSTCRLITHFIHIPNPERQVDMSPHHTLHTYTTPRETGRHVATPHTSYIYQTLRDRSTCHLITHFIHIPNPERQVDMSPHHTLHTYTTSQRQVDMSPHHTLHTYTKPWETGRHVATPHTSYIYQTLRDRSTCRLITHFIHIPNPERQVDMSPHHTLHTYTTSQRQVDMSPHHTLHTYTKPWETGRHVATSHTSYIYQTPTDRSTCRHITHFIHIPNPKRQVDMSPHHTLESPMVLTYD